MEVPAVAEAMARQFGADLYQRFPTIERCHVVVERIHQRDLVPARFVVGIDIAAPSGDVSIRCESVPDPPGEDVHHTLGSAFAAAGFQLERDAGRVRTEIHDHAHEPLGRISRLLPDQGYGFISTDNAQEVYFHESAVANEAFVRLVRGSNVRFTFCPADSDARPCADSVYLLPW